MNPKKMFEDLRNRLGKARNAYIERQGEVNRVLAESKTRFKAEREAEERLILLEEGI